MQAETDLPDSQTHSTHTADALNQQTNIAATAPGQIRVIKRNGTVVPYDNSKISVAISKAFLAVEGGNAAASSRIHDTVSQLLTQVSTTFLSRMPSGGTIHIEDIQDQVELALMRSSAHKVARAYVLYREEHARQRAASTPALQRNLMDLQITMEDGSSQAIDLQRLETIVNEACTELDEVDPQQILNEALKNIYDGISIHDINTSLVMTARTMVEREPNYGFVAARLLLDSLRSEALRFLDITDSATQSEMHSLYTQALPAFITRGVELAFLSPELKDFDLAKLGNAIKAERDLQFTYLGLQTLYERYFIHSDGTRFELPQLFFMRIAMGLAIKEQDKTERAIEFYDLLSSFDYMCSSTTLCNAGTLRPQLSSCYLSTVADDLHSIYAAIQDNAMLSKWAGGLGNDWTAVRALGAPIKGTNGKSQGVVPFLKVVNDTAVAVNQGGKRKGAVCSYLESWHLDIEEFLELRKNTGDERRRTHDMNTASWIPDLFMKRVFEDKDWTLFSPSDVADLHDLYGSAFEARYEAYELMADNGEIHLFKKVQAKALWRKMLDMLFETGHPWITFKDACNLRSPQQHVGVIHSSNLCTEITLNTCADEIAVCNLGSINLSNHINEQTLNSAKLEKTITTAVRMLDNIVDINYYAVKQARMSNLRHRPIGMGIMGFQDALYKLSIPYSSDKAVEFADQSMETISYFAIQASSNLAAERGSYSTFEGSLWSRGILPIDSLKILKKHRGDEFLDLDESQQLDWSALRKTVKNQGIRNSNIMAIAPTTSIANITGVSASIEPSCQNLYVKSNLSGEFIVINPYLVKDLKARGLWDAVMVNDLKYYEGSVQKIDRIPHDLKTIYATAFEIEPRWLVDAASRRQKWLDQAQSLNLYINNASGKKLDITYRMAWYRGLKTTCYLRTPDATSVEKSSLSNKETLNTASSSVKTVTAAKACSIDDPYCEAYQ